MKVAMIVTLVDINPAGSPLPLPLYSSRVPAGFPSPADDYLEKHLDLGSFLIKRPASTFFVRAEGTSMINAGILDKALLIVDRSLTPQHNDIVIAALDGQLTCKILDLKKRELRSANLSYLPMPIAEGNELEVLGVVIHVVNSLCTRW